MAENDLVRVFIPSDYADQLSQGSYETLRDRLTDVIEENREQFTEIADAEVYLINTFKGYVHVGTSEGKLFRAQYSDTKKGLSLKGVESLNVPLINESNVHDVIEDELGKVWDMFVEGKGSKAWDTFKGVAELVDVHVLYGGYDNTERFVENVLKAPWRYYITQQKKSLGGLLKVESDGVAVRFESVYNGELNEEQYTDELAQDVAGSVDELLTGLETVIESTHTSLDNYKGPDKLTETGQAFSTFAHQFSTTLERQLNEARRILRVNGCIACWAKVHDGFADIAEEIRIGVSLINHVAQEAQN